MVRGRADTEKRAMTSKHVEPALGAELFSVRIAGLSPSRLGGFYFWIWFQKNTERLS